MVVVHPAALTSVILEKVNTADMSPQEARYLTRLLDASSPRYCFTGSHQPSKNSPEASGMDAIPSCRVAVADARTYEWEISIGGSLRWLGS
jgi:hypothetical protein